MTLTNKQKNILNDFIPKCQQTCKFLYPINMNEEKNCIEKCNLQNKELFELTNLSYWGVFIAIFIIFLVIILRLK